MREIRNQILTGERAVFKQKELAIYDTIFCDGESPIKECASISVDNCFFKWRYPIWYGKDITVKDCVLFDDARAGLWYLDNVTVSDTVIKAPKCIRRCKKLSLKNVDLTDAQETVWECDGVTIENVQTKGEYFCMNSKNITADKLTLVGQYSFDGVSNVEIHNSKLVTKDAFWNSQNVTVYDSYIFSEYIGWNSKNLTFVNCTIESLQGFCYVENLVLKNCKLINTTLAFEYSTVNVDVKGKIDSVFNPKSGFIKAESIGQLLLDSNEIDPKLTIIDCADIQSVELK